MRARERHKLSTRVQVTDGAPQLHCFSDFSSTRIGIAVVDALSLPLCTN